MDWDDMRTFLAIARHGTLSGAARALRVSQPTMGRRLAAMEERNGARLLQRTPGRFALTALGETVLGNAERMEAEALAAARTITGRDIALEGVVRLTTVDTLAARIVTPAIAALHAQHPGISLEIVPQARLMSLSKREADVALRMTPFQSQTIAARRVGRLAMGIYASKDYVAKAASGDIRLITVLEDQATLSDAAWLHGLYPDAPIALRSNSREVQLWAAKSGIGIAALARICGDQEDDLVRLHGDSPGSSRDIWLGVHLDMRHMPRIRAVIEAVALTFKQQAHALDPDGAA